MVFDCINSGPGPSSLVILSITAIGIIFNKHNHIASVTLIV